MLVSLAIAAAALILDQLTKYWAQTSLQAMGGYSVVGRRFSLPLCPQYRRCLFHIGGAKLALFIFTAVVVAGMAGIFSETVKACIRC